MLVGREKELHLLHGKLAGLLNSREYIIIIEQTA